MDEARRPDLPDYRCQFHRDIAANNTDHASSVEYANGTDIDGRVGSALCRCRRAFIRNGGPLVEAQARRVGQGTFRSNRRPVLIENMAATFAIAEPPSDLPVVLPEFVDIGWAKAGPGNPDTTALWMLENGQPWQVLQPFPTPR